MTEEQEKERNELIEELRRTLYSNHSNPGVVLRASRSIMDRIAQVHHQDIE